jgi:hypothetical protein
MSLRGKGLVAERLGDSGVVEDAWAPLMVDMVGIPAT